LTKTSRPKGCVQFAKASKREKDLIAKGGDTGIDLGGKSEIFHNPDAKFKVSMRKIDKGIPILHKITDRKGGFGSMYKQE